MALISVITVPVPACPRLTPCWERAAAMVTMAISKPVIEVLGWFQMFERVFMQDAPWIETGSTGRPGLTIVVSKTTRTPAPNKPGLARGGGVIRRRPAAGSGFAALSSGSCRGFGLDSSGESVRSRQKRFRTPAPSANLGRACSFARRGISVLRLAIYKGREMAGIGLQKSI